MLTFTTAQLSSWAGLYWWPLLRILALFMSAPLLSHRAIPLRSKIGLSIAIAFVVAPTLPAGRPVELDSLQAIELTVQQILIGLSIGFAVRLTMTAIEFAGELIGLQMGLSYAGFFNPQTRQESTAIGSWMGILAMLFFLAINGHLLLIDAIYDSFQRFPIGGPLLPAKSPLAIASLGAAIFQLALQLALPFITMMLIVNLAMGTMMRVAPQLNLLSVGMPLSLSIGFGSLLLLMPYLERPITDALGRSLRVYSG